jgi:hypothetical protein
MTRLPLSGDRRTKSAPEALSGKMRAGGVERHQIIVIAIVESIGRSISRMIRPETAVQRVSGSRHYGIL